MTKEQKLIKNFKELLSVSSHPKNRHAVTLMIHGITFFEELTPRDWKIERHQDLIRGYYRTATYVHDTHMVLFELKEGF